SDVIVALLDVIVAASRGGGGGAGLDLRVERGVLRVAAFVGTNNIFTGNEGLGDDLFDKLVAGLEDRLGFGPGGVG
ncbi:11025_t:CDS:2, partial [Racocetra persica]